MTRPEAGQGHPGWRTDNLFPSWRSLMMVMILLVILELTHVLLGLSTLPTQILVHCLLLAAQYPRIMSHGLETDISLAISEIIGFHKFFTSFQS